RAADLPAPADRVVLRRHPGRGQVGGHHLRCDGAADRAGLRRLPGADPRHAARDQRVRPGRGRLAGDAPGPDRPHAPGERARRGLGVRQSYKIAIAVGATLAILGPLAWFWQGSLVPSTYDMASMGYPDYGGGQQTGHAHGSGGLDVATLTGPSTGTPDVVVT